MRATPSGDTEWERREREIARRARNCIIAAIVVFIVVAVITH